MIVINRFYLAENHRHFIQISENGYIYEIGIVGGGCNLSKEEPMIIGDLINVQKEIRVESIDELKQYRSSYEQLIYPINILTYVESNDGVFLKIDDYRFEKMTIEEYISFKKYISTTQLFKEFKYKHITGSREIGVCNADNSLNVREKPGTDSMIVDSMLGGDICEVVHKYCEVIDKTVWCKVKYNQIYGYCAQRYLDIEEILDFSNVLNRRIYDPFKSESPMSILSISIKLFTKPIVNGAVIQFRVMGVVRSSNYIKPSELFRLFKDIMHINQCVDITIDGKHRNLLFMQDRDDVLDALKPEQIIIFRKIDGNLVGIETGHIMEVFPIEALEIAKIMPKRLVKII